MQHKQDDHFPWLTKMTTPTSNGVHTYSFQVRSDITTTSSLKNLYSTTNIHGQPPPHHQGATHYGFIGWQLKYWAVTMIFRRQAVSKAQPTNGTYRGVGDEQELTAGTFPFARSSRSNRPGRRWDGDGSVLCLTPFFSSSPWEMKKC